MFGRIFTPKQPPPSTSTRSSSNRTSQRERRRKQLPLNLKNPLNITMRQFGQRLVPDHLENSSIEGQDCLESINYWIEVVKLGLEEGAPYLSHGIRRVHLFELQATLEDYAATTKLFTSTDNQRSPRDRATTALQKVKKLLSEGKKAVYLPLGYIAGPSNSGHAIPLKIRPYQKVLELLFLNLGEGAQMHPQLFWKEMQLHYHFQSFPIQMTPQKFYGPEGVELFRRQIKLLQISPQGTETPYSAEDCYAPFWELGDVQSTFDSSLLSRAEPPQRGPICVDMATVLVIKDVLIDLGYDRKTICRFFLNEQLSALISFKTRLEKQGSYEEWSLLKKGIETFSIQLLQLPAKTLLKEELDDCRLLCDELATLTECVLEKLKPSLLTLPSLKTDKTRFESSLIETSSLKIDIKHKVNAKQDSVTPPLPQPQPPSPSELLSTLITWTKHVSMLQEPERTTRFAYHTLLLLPPPTPEKNDYWDHLPAKEIKAVMKQLTLFIDKSLVCWDEEKTRHTNIIVIYTAYAIIDKLARRLPELKLDGFASPYRPSSISKTKLTPLEKPFFSPSLKGETEFFNFDLLPFKPSNLHWAAVRYYFETQLAKSSSMLFSLEDREPNLLEGVEVLQKQTNTFSITPPTPLSEHLSYLQQFFRKEWKTGDPRALAGYFAKLWVNRNCAYLPEEYEYLYFFALYAWTAPKIGSSIPFTGRVRRSLVKQKLTLPISINTLKTIQYASKSLPNLGFEPLFLPQEEEASENKAVCQKGRRHFIWDRIFSTPEMRITSIIQFIKLNLYKLDLHDRDFIERGLFEPGFLPKKIYEEPKVLDQLRSLFSEGLAYFQCIRDPDTVFFCIRIALALETFALSPDIPRLKRLEATLLKMVNNRTELTYAYHHLLLLYRIVLPNGKESAAECIKGSFYLGYFEGVTPLLPNWVVAENSCLFNLHQEEIRSYFNDPKWREEIAKAVLSEFLPTLPPSPSAAAASYPHIHYGPYTLNIESLNIHREKKKSSESLVVLHQQSEFDHIAWIEKGTFLSTNEKRMLKKDPKTGNYHLWEEMEIEGVEKNWYQKCSLVNTSQHPLSSLFKKHDIWVEYTKSHPHHFVIKNHCLIVKASSGEKETVIYQLRNGKRTGLVLANLNKSPLQSFFKRLGIYEEVWCWMDPETSQIEEIEWLEGKLTFKCEKNGYRCLQYPEYLLSEKQSLETLNHFTGTIVLTNGSKECVLLPIKQLSIDGKDFSPKVSLTPFSLTEGGSSNPSASLATNKDTDEKSFFFFTVDPFSKVLISDDPQANLYLTLLLAKQRDYKKALYYLNRAHSFEVNPEPRKLNDCLMEMFYELKDESPEALAFYLHVGEHYIENFSQPILKHYFGKRIHLTKNIRNRKMFLWVGTMYVKYLKVISTQPISAVPKYCRLTPGQELFLLNKIKRILVSADNLNKKRILSNQGVLVRTFSPDLALHSLELHWPPICDVRKNLLSSTDGKSTQTITIQTYPTQLADYFILPLQSIHEATLWPVSMTVTSEEEINDFVRIALKDVRKHFISLYYKVRSGRGALDVLYIIRSCRKQDSAVYSFAALLHYVGKYPNSFSHLNFTQDPKENKKTFIKIVATANSLAAKVTRSISTVKNLFARTVTFVHHNRSTLKLPEKPLIKPLSWQSVVSNRSCSIDCFYQSVSTHFLTHHLEVVTAQPLFTQTAFVFKDFRPATQSEATIIATLREGYRSLKNPTPENKNYTLRRGCTLSNCYEKAKTLLSEKKRDLQALKKETEEQANAYPPTSSLMGLQKRGRDLPLITIEGILTDAYEKKDPMLLRSANPSLPPRAVKILLLNTVKYHLLRIQIASLEKALQTTSVQAFGEAITVHLTLSALDEPEIYLFQSRSQKVLWPKQAALMQWYYQASRRNRITLFAAPAGLGKTTLFQPIVMKRMNRQGFFPVSVSPRSLYLVDREGLRHVTQHVSSLQIAVWELALNTETTAKDFKWLYDKICDYKNLKGLKITPEVYSALLLKYELALEAGDEEAVRWISYVLDLLERRASALVDECRLNLSPFTQSEIGIGKPLPLPKIDRKVFIEIYRALTSSALQSTVGLQRNLQATIDEKEYLEIRKTVCRSLLGVKCFKIPSTYREAIFAYWMGKGDEPEWLRKQAGKPHARAIDLVTIYFEEFFSSAMNCVGNMQHVRSLKWGEEIHVPAKKRQATRAYFKEVYATLITTIQGVLQSGLDKEQAKCLYNKIREVHVEEVGKREELSPIEQKLQTWLNDPTVRLSDFPPSKKESFSRFFKALKNNSGAILYYLEHFVLKQVTYCPEQLVVNPIHFLNAFRRTTLFSADPGPQEIYGLHGPSEAIRTDSAFLAHVVQQLVAPQNRDFTVFPAVKSPLQLFEWLFQNKKEIFKDLAMLADIGGTLRDFSTEEIANDFFRFIERHQELDFDGIILFEDASTKEEMSEQLLILKGWEKPKVLKGNDVVSALAAHGLRWSKLKLLTIIDPSHGPGANIKQLQLARALLLLGEELSLGDLIQGVMRLRAFLSTQVITWGLSTQLANKIKKSVSSSINPLTFLIWTLQNEGIRVDKEILLSAFQQITYFVEQQAREELKRHINSPREQIKIWKKYRKGFVLTYNWDPIHRFKGKQKEAKASDVLLLFAQKLYARFGYQTPFQKIKPDLHPIIQAVEKRRPTLPIKETMEISRQTQMHTYQKQKTEQDQHKVSNFDLKPLKQSPLPSWLKIDGSLFLSILVSYATESKTLFESPFLTPNVWFTHNLINTAQTGKKELGIEYLKPAQYILLVREKKKFYAFALSDEEGSFFQKQLVSMKEGNRQVALLNIDGTFAQNGKGNFAFKDEDLNSRFVRDCILDIGLSRCELFYPKRLIERIGSWTDFWPMWTKIKSSQPFLPETSIRYIEKLIPAHIRNYKKPEPKGFLSNFFTFSS